LIELLKKFNVPHRSYWISNAIAAVIPANLLELLGAHRDVESISSNNWFKVDLEEPIAIEEEEAGEEKRDGEWNVEWVNGDDCWAIGIDGNGTVYANADTGVQHTPPEISTNYRGSSSGHDYNWWDGVKEYAIPGPGQCGIDSQVPCDDNGHGTHTTGTSVGTLGCGVAPGARWIACRNMDRGYGSPESYISCLQFFLAPTNLDGNGANPDLRPDAIGNSYGCPTSEGCAPDSLNDAADALRAAGVFMSVSAGNSGSGCSSINDPPGLIASVISVGATGYQTNAIASYSSRGPITRGSAAGMAKPEIVAPGSSVRSCVPTNRYASYSGTSMASPHVGAAVLMVAEACPSFRYDVDQIQSLLESTATPLTTTQFCGNDGPGDVPNNVFGHGQLNVLAAINACRQ